MVASVANVTSTRARHSLKSLLMSTQLHGLQCTSAKMLGLAKHRKDSGNGFVKDNNWEAALLCYLNGLYLLQYPHVAKGKSKLPRSEGVPSAGTAASCHGTEGSPEQARPQPV